ncbi:MAG: NOL1/NOP2/sun family putative RNA methylase [Desulfobacterales bacterium]|nr:NOL1/NOP2/sun family putative RNA methylase [Desulfobacterales bacterium]
MNPIFERYRDIIPDFSLFQESLHNPFPTHLRVNRIKTEPVLVVESLKAKGIHLKGVTEKNNTLYFASSLNTCGNLLEYFLGHIHPQALTSCLASIALGPEPGSYVLDMCASPGGKTAHLAELMHNKGFIVANELNSQRQIPLGHTLERLGVMNAVITGYQAQEFPMKHRFDYILADVPCSGEGRFRQTKEDLTYRETAAKTKLPDLQKKIILRGFDLLKESGEMLYSTCTYNPEENESVVSYLLDNRDAKLLPIQVGLDYDPGLIQWGNQNYEKQLESTARFYPHRIDSVGFFMARIGRGK